MNIPLTNRYQKLGNDFYAACLASPVKRASMIRFNHALAAEFGMDAQACSEQDLAEYFSGNRLLPGSEPLAMVYAGHQFGHYNPQLGDGRALYLGEVQTPSGEYIDVQLKGSGPTPYSRNGDGRAALGPVLREYLVSEAMHALGVPTTRALAAVSTGESVFRDAVIPGAVITRTASSFIRVGSFQYFLMNHQVDAVKQLADYVIERNYPELASAENPYRALFDAVVSRQAHLIAEWMQLGFIHGVMNTDNVSVAGETIDYGPCAFMDAYQHDQVFSSIDRNGRYAYANQPNIAVWNLARFAEALLPLFDEDPDAAVTMAQAALGKFAIQYEKHWLSGFRAKCGLSQVENVRNSDDKLFLEKLLNIMHDNKADFTLTFYRLSRLSDSADQHDDAFLELFRDHAKINDWLISWRDRLSEQTQSEAQRQAAMQSANPAVIPRNHQIERVIRAAEDHDDFAPFHELHAVLSQPFQARDDGDAFMQPPKADEMVQQTFCGT